MALLLRSDVMVKEVSYIRLAIHQLKDILTQKKGQLQGKY